MSSGVVLVLMIKNMLCLSDLMIVYIKIESISYEFIKKNNFNMFGIFYMNMMH